MRVIAGDQRERRMAELQLPFKLLEIEVAGRSIFLPDLARYQKFYGKLRSGTWEPRTFKTLAANLDESTIYVDIGAWIGVTPFWASHSSKRVIAVEPDPECQQILTALAPLYPKVEIIDAALSPDRTVVINSISGFGSSETSALEIGEGTSVLAQGITIKNLMARAGDEPVFVKIDVEGYEFRIVHEIAQLGRYRLKGLQCAVHPQLLEKSLKGAKLIRRLKVLLATISLWRTLAPIAERRAVPRYGSFLRYLVFGILLRSNSKGTDFLFLNFSGKA
jgi:FkbM family methyltransferase